MCVACVCRYKTILPMVKAQVESQIKVRDLSNAKLSIEPADATSWGDVRTELIAEKKALLRSELETELSAAADESAVEELRKGFSRKERMIEHEVDTQVHHLPFYLYSLAFYTALLTDAYALTFFRCTPSRPPSTSTTSAFILQPLYPHCTALVIHYSPFNRRLFCALRSFLAK